jgi:hypothetical protein
MVISHPAQMANHSSATLTAIYYLLYRFIDYNLNKDLLVVERENINLDKEYKTS